MTPTRIASPLVLALVAALALGGCAEQRKTGERKPTAPVSVAASETAPLSEAQKKLPTKAMFVSRGMMSQGSGASTSQEAMQQRLTFLKGVTSVAEARSRWPWAHFPTITLGGKPFFVGHENRAKGAGALYVLYDNGFELIVEWDPAKDRMKPELPMFASPGEKPRYVGPPMSNVSVGGLSGVAIKPGTQRYHGQPLERPGSLRWVDGHAEYTLIDFTRSTSELVRIGESLR